MTAARQWRLAWVLRVVPGTDNHRRKSRQAKSLSEHVPGRRGFQPLSLPGPWKGSNAVRGDELGRAHPFWRRTDDGHYPCVQRARGAVEV